MRKITAFALTGCLLWNSGYAGVASAASPSSKVELNAEEILFPGSTLRGDLTRRLNQREVLEELAKMGIQKSEVEARMAAMSDDELRQVQEGIQRQVGGDVITLSITTLLLIIIVILIIK